MRAAVAALVAVCVAATAAACGGGDDPLPTGMSEQDKAIGAQIVTGVATLWPLAEAGDMDGLHQAGLDANRAAEQYREQGDHPCIQAANEWWWLVVSQTGQLAALATPSGRDTTIASGAERIPDVVDALNSCPPAVQDAIGWDTTSD